MTEVGPLDADFESAFRSCFIPLYRFVVARLPGDEERARDIVQDCFEALAASLRAGKEGGGFDGRSTILTWLCAVARRKIADKYRRELRAARFLGERRRGR